MSAIFVCPSRSDNCGNCYWQAHLSAWWCIYELSRFSCPTRFVYAVVRKWNTTNWKFLEVTFRCGKLSGKSWINRPPDSMCDDDALREKGYILSVINKFMSAQHKSRTIERKFYDPFMMSYMSYNFSLILSHK